jgi:hypothetical protein
MRKVVLFHLNQNTEVIGHECTLVFLRLLAQDCHVGVYKW